MREPPPDPFVRILAPLERIASRNSELAHHGPAARSQAARDGVTTLGRMAWDLASTANGIGLDHLQSWRELRLPSPGRAPNGPVAGVQPTFGHLALIRASIEGTATARWLCDPAIGQPERIRRAAGVQLADFEQRASFERGLGGRVPKPQPGGRTAQQRIDGLRRLLHKHQVAPIGMPSATRLFGLYALGEVESGAGVGAVDGEALFRLISALAHAKQWAVLAIGEMTALIAQPGGRQAARVEPREDLALGVTAVGIRVASAALADLERYGAGR